jgi:hypothetical protein
MTTRPTTPNPATATTPTTTPNPATNPATTDGRTDASLLRLPKGRRPAPTRTRLSTRRLPVIGYAVAGVVLLAGIVIGSMARGWWSTSCGGVNEVAVAAGTLAPVDVKGSMTVQQVADGFPAITTGDVLAAFGAPADTPTSTQLKTLVQNGSTIDVTDFRTWLEQRPIP